MLTINMTVIQTHSPPPLNIFINNLIKLGIGDWGLGIGDWGLGIGDWANPQSPIPNPQSPALIELIILNKFK